MIELDASATGGDLCLFLCLSIARGERELSKSLGHRRESSAIVLISANGIKLP